MLSPQDAMPTHQSKSLLSTLLKMNSQCMRLVTIYLCLKFLNYYSQWARACTTTWRAARHHVLSHLLASVQQQVV